ncbi:MAG: tRNA (N6-isopentenyl adenosine(37)-C2)-methylthiotransferase MiaB, partial [Opitutales bacterium]|nr:tRNA (N6-isopentenyl adenosine(37)-C2)-methylthiotransferase MiaB [Opitutales bacterium]
MEQTVYIKTYGCQMNERESEALAAVLRQAGYQLVDRETDAAIILLNTCSVREQ